MTPLYTFERVELERVTKLNQQMASLSKQEDYQQRMREEGLAQVHGWVHEHQLTDVVVLIHKLRASPHFIVGPIRHAFTSKLFRLR